MRSASTLLVGVAGMTFIAFGTVAAAVPVLSGVYSYNSDEICPAGLTITRSRTGQLTNIVTNASGDVTVNVLTLSLNPGAETPNAGTITGPSFQNELVGTLQGPGQTIQSTDKAVTVSGTFTNTANSTTIGAVMAPRVRR